MAVAGGKHGVLCALGGCPPLQSEQKRQPVEQQKEAEEPQAAASTKRGKRRRSRGKGPAKSNQTWEPGPSPSEHPWPEVSLQLQQAAPIRKAVWSARSCREERRRMFLCRVLASIYQD